MPQVSVNKSGSEPSNHSTLAEQKENLEKAVSSSIQQVSDKLSDQYSQVHDYIQNADLQSTLRDVGSMIRRHPVTSAAIGIGLGMLVGRMLRR